MPDRTLQRKIHVACRQLGLDNAARQDIQLLACGKASMREMDDGDLRLVISHLEKQGWKSAPAKGKKFHKPAPRGDLRYIHVMWRLLGEKGVLKQPGRAGLNAFIRKRFEPKWGSVPIDIDTMREPAEINAVVRALTEWCEREVIVLEQ